MSSMVMTNKDIADLNKQLDKIREDKGPNDLERRISNLEDINKSHQKLNGDLRAETSDVINEFRNKGDM